VGTRSWTTPKLISATSASGEAPTRLEDQSALFTATPPEHDTYTLVVETDASGSDALRIEALADDRLPAKGPGRVKHGNFVLSEITVTAAPISNPTASQPVVLTRAEADIEQSGYPAAHAIDGNTSSGWAIHNGDGALGEGVFDATRGDVNDARRTVLGIRDHSCLATGERPGIVTEGSDGHGHERHRNALASGEKHVHFAR
jgi:hypothetical protein